MENKICSGEFKLWLHRCCEDAKKRGLSERQICESLSDVLIAKLYNKIVKKTNEK